MIDCCELALANAQLAKHIAWGAFALIALLFVVVFGYNLKWRKQQIELSQRTNQLEKKNGKELAEIAKLKQRINHLENFADKGSDISSCKEVYQPKKADPQNNHDHD